MVKCIALEELVIGEANMLSNLKCSLTVADPGFFPWRGRQL